MATPLEPDTEKPEFAPLLVVRTSAKPVTAFHHIADICKAGGFSPASPEAVVKSKNMSVKEKPKPDINSTLADGGVAAKTIIRSVAKNQYTQTIGWQQQHRFISRPMGLHRRSVVSPDSPEPSYSRGRTALVTIGCDYGARRASTSIVFALLLAKTIP